MFPKIGVPQNGWFIMENHIKMDDLGVSLFSETSMLVFGKKWGSFMDFLIMFFLFFHPQTLRNASPPPKFNRDAGSLLESSRFWQKLLFQFLDMEVQCWDNIAGIDFFGQLLLLKSFSVY